MNPREGATWSWVVPQIYERADLAILAALETGEGQSIGTLPKISRSQLKKLIDEDRVTSNGAPIAANSKLKVGLEIKIEFPPPQPTEIQPENRPLDILFEDEYLVIVNKPPRLTVHPSATQMEGTLVHALLHHIQDLSGIGGVLRPGIVHRIDKNTSGALVITKTDEAHRGLADIFSRHEIERAYWALCYGSPPGPSNTQDLIKIESLIGRNPNDRKKMSMTVTEGRKAISYYKKLGEYGIPQKKPFASWLEVTLETGRTHQVRVHLTGVGYSILGDPAYGVPTQNHPKWMALPQKVRGCVEQMPGQALHARVLGFEHPITKKHIRVEAPLPPEFAALLESLKEFC